MTLIYLGSVLLILLVFGFVLLRNVFLKAQNSGWYPFFLMPVVQAIFADTGNKKILDIRTGPGKLPELLIRHNPQLQITATDIDEAMIDEAITYAKKYPKPKTNYIYYISGNSVDAFKYQRQVAGQFNTGVSGTTVKQVLHSTWKNVVVFETYAGNNLVNITMAGTDSASNSLTSVPWPDGATRIEAVGFDGTRILVYGTR